ncbi:MAG: hypothetical protein MHPSP_003983, partial [Paramarteilia canceri]
KIPEVVKDGHIFDISSNFSEIGPYQLSLPQGSQVTHEDNNKITKLFIPFNHDPEFLENFEKISVSSIDSK